MTDTTDEIGAGAYGTRHVMEEQMRDAGQGVFATKEGVPSEKPLARMTKDELLAEAAKRDVAIESDDTKPQIIAKLESAS